MAAIREVGGRDWRSGTSPAAEPPSPPVPHEAAGGLVLGESVFKDALVRERKRADRFDAPFAVLLVDRSDVVSDARPWISVLGAVAAVKREADAVGWLDEGAVLALLLPEVSRGGALRVMERLRHEISARVGDSVLAAVSMRVYAHGVEPGPDGVAFPPVDLLIENFVHAHERPGHAAAKRALDIVGSLAMMAIFAPVMLLAMIAVKVTSPGPVFLRQVRIGRRGEPFKMLKLRTMYVNAGHGIHQDYMAWFIKSSGKESHTGADFFKIKDDPAHHAPRTRPPADEPRRDPAVPERPAGRNVARGPAAAAALRSGSVPAVAPAAGARGEAGDHRPLAGERPEPDDVRRHGAPGPALRTDAHAVDRHHNPGRDAAGHVQRRDLMDTFNSIAPDVKLGRDVKLSKFINMYGCEIGDETKIGASVEIQKGVKVGRRCKISSHTFICEGVTIEDNVFIGHGVMFTNDVYPRATTPSGGLQTEADWKVETTVVKQGASIGTGATILPRVTIGEHAMVGAGSVVTRNVPPRTIVWGNPARVLRHIVVGEEGAK